MGKWGSDADWRILCEWIELPFEGIARGGRVPEASSMVVRRLLLSRDPLQAAARKVPAASGAAVGKAVRATEDRMQRCRSSSQAAWRRGGAERCFLQPEFQLRKKAVVAIPFQ
jgi:hypothetical protein